MFMYNSKTNTSYARAESKTKFDEFDLTSKLNELISRKSANKANAINLSYAKNNDDSYMDVNHLDISTNSIFKKKNEKSNLDKSYTSVNQMNTSSISQYNNSHLRSKSKVYKSIMNLS